MSHSFRELEKATILFAGDSGDGIQLTGAQFSNTTANAGNDLRTFPDFPAEIRAPVGTVAGVSGFKINFGGIPVYTPGGKVDVLVAFNAAALRKNLQELKTSGLIIANTGGFDAKNLKLCGLPDDARPLDDARTRGFRVVELDITGLTREALANTGLGTKDKDRSKNMFALGLIYWLYDRKPDFTEAFLNRKFKSQPDVLEANLSVLRAGYHYGETTELFAERYRIPPAALPPGVYRNVTGNQALALGLVAASNIAGTDLFYAGYPITPASDILHELALHKRFGVRTFQAEDEIAAIGAALGASFGGALGATASSGPGLALKAETIGLAVMTELPLVVVNVQRGGPSTGLPTKTEQADLLQAVYGRNGEAPVPVIAAHTPTSCFDAAYEACQVALEHLTPVLLLSDGYLANGAEPWKFPQSADLPEINIPYAELDDEHYLPYKRDERGVRRWAVPGTAGLEHRLGGLEKEAETGNVSYDAANHERMVKERAAKVAAISRRIAPLEYVLGGPEDELLLLGWGSTYGAIRVATEMLRNEGLKVAQLHLRWINPFPDNLEELLHNHREIMIPELNNGQLIRLIRDRFLLPAKGLNKIQGQPFLAAEVADAARKMLSEPVNTRS